MKKLITIMLVALIPFATMAQKKSKKDQAGELKFMTIYGVSVSHMSVEEIDMAVTDIEPNSEEAHILHQKLTSGKLKISFES